MTDSIKNYVRGKMKIRLMGILVGMLFITSTFAGSRYAKPYVMKENETYLGIKGYTII